ncbi:MAG: tetratricopeptide repeat protein, partial [Bacteroidia bacterium]|nr:tetratricopeptide repeat protein [Bacteroidia bacterium]
MFSFVLYTGYTVIFLVLLWGCTSQSIRTNEPSTILSSADSIIQEKKAALEGLNRQITKNPNQPILYYERSYLYYQLGDTNMAISDIDFAISKDSLHVDYLYQGGFYHYIAGHYDQAEKLFRRAAELGSPNPETYYQIGNILVLKKKYQEAQTWYDKAIQKDPKDPMYDYAKGFAYRQAKNIPKAIQSLESALQKDSLFIKALAELCDIALNELKQIQKAYQYNRKILLSDS